MKALPDYLIEYMPYVEDAIEELRLSVIDHAYDLLKSLDIDELTSSDIRTKLETLGLKLKSMTGEWLPNGRFYRMYSSIKHHRSRKNGISAVVKSGGQFEGVWSYNFNEKQQYNYKYIQLLRHYEFASELDGYFFISGNATRRSNGSIVGNTISLLSSDDLLNQSLPAGYTYIYVPWPRPSYPEDSNYFYNAHMLQYDRLHYSEDCKSPYSGVYSTLLPASMQYYSLKTSMQPPYWYDYHFTGDTMHPNYVANQDKYEWPIKEVGYYYNSDGLKIARLCIDKDKKSTLTYLLDGNERDLDENNEEDKVLINLVNTSAVEYKLEDHSKLIANTNSNGITNCYLHSLYKTSEPNRSQVFTPTESTLTINFRDIESDLFDKESVTKISLRYISDTGTNIDEFANNYNSDSNSIVVSGVNKYDLSAISSASDAVVLNNISDIDLNELAISMFSIFDSHRTHSHVLKYKENLLHFLDYIWFTIKYSDELGVNCSINKPSTREEFCTLINNIPKSPVIIDSYDDERETDIVSFIYNLNPSIMTKDDIVTLLRGVSSGPVTLPDYTGVLYDALYIINNLTALGATCHGSGTINANASIEHNWLFECSTAEMTIDENCLIEPHLSFSPKPSAYRFDRLAANAVYRDRIGQGHIKTYRPFWDVPSPLFAMMQYNDSLDDKANHSLYYWMSLKETENEPKLTDSAYVYDESLVSKETFTSFDRPTVGRMDPIYMAVFYSADSGNQGNTYTLSQDETDNCIYCYGENDRIEYNPELSYTVITSGKQNGDIDENPNKLCIVGEPALKQLYIATNDSTYSAGNITYKTSKVHKMWFSPDKRNTALNIAGTKISRCLYNNASQMYRFSGGYNNTVSITYNILGVYTEDGKKVETDTLQLICDISNHRYNVYYNVGSAVTASYILFTVSVAKGSVVETSGGTADGGALIRHVTLSRLTDDLGTAEITIQNNE